MIDDKSAQAEGQALPAETQPAKAGFFSRAEKTVVTDAERVITAVENWYALHFHKATIAGRQPISAEDKAALVAAVTKAASAQQE